VALNKIARPATVPDIGFRALLLRQRYDLVHVHAHPTSLWGLGDTPLVMSEGSSSAVYLTEYLGWTAEMVAASYTRSGRIYKALGIHDRLLNLSRVDRLYVFSEWAREINLSWGADPAKVSVIYPGFPTPPFTPKPERPELFTFLFVGTDFERKGGHDVIEAYEQVASDLPNVHLVLAGFNTLAPNPDLLLHGWASQQRRTRVATLLAELERRGRLTRFAEVSHARLAAELFPAADAFVMPTRAEGFGFTNVEAMSFGLPVITSTAGPADEIVVNGKTGILISPGDVAGVAAAMAEIATYPALARELGIAGRKRFEERFTLDRFRGELAALYTQVVNSR
jgi:glycosyltransferase involved in cell wall biosynthesis